MPDEENGYDVDMATSGNSPATCQTAISLNLDLATALIAAVTAAGVEFRSNAATVGFTYELDSHISPESAIAEIIATGAAT